MLDVVTIVHTGETLGDDGSVLHLYRESRERLRLGDIARCGHVKTVITVFPSNVAAEASGTPLCARCQELAELEDK